MKPLVDSHQLPVFSGDGRLLLSAALCLLLCSPVSDSHAAAVIATNLASADVTFSDGTVGNGNVGKYGYINADIYGGNGIRRMIIKWDLSSIPLGSKINSAQVNIYRYSVTDNCEGYLFSLYRVTNDWTEGHGTSAGSTPLPFYPSGANWVNRKIEGPDGYGEGDPLDTDDPSAWVTPGVDFDPASQVQFTGVTVYDPINAANFGMQPSITNIVQSWVSGEQPNYGIIVVSDHSGARHAMRSRDYGYPDDGRDRPAPGVFAPQLVLDYFPMPAVTNNDITDQAGNSAALRGTLVTGQYADAWICWGTNDAGTVSTSDWDNVVSIGTVTQSVMFSTVASGLGFNEFYWYRCYATNECGTCWSSPATRFSAVLRYGTVLTVK